jgi:phage terminase large subunit
MINIDLSNVPSRMNLIFHKLVEDTHRINIVMGGASSGKSYDVFEKVVYKTLVEDGHRYLIIRKVARTLRHSVFDLLCGIISSWGMMNLFKINKTDLAIYCIPTKNEIIFSGLDDVEKLKSIYGITDIVVEEAPEITEADFNQLDLRLRGETKHKKQMTLILNPISIMHWIKKRFYDRVEPDCITHHSTYKDNKFLDKDTITRIEQITDPYFRDVYVLGKWGVFGNVVFTNYVIEEFGYGEDDLENVRTGMDFGVAHASAIERIGFHDDEIYCFDELYGKGWTNADLLGAAQETWGDSAHRWIITADSAEPDRIIEWNRAGWENVSGAKKGAGSLRYGIDYLCSKKMHIHASKCPHMAQEVQSFKRREDKDGNAIDAFVEINDDCIAAARYACEDIWANPVCVLQVPLWGAGDLGL